jgi:hypothetical protein
MTGPESGHYVCLATCRSNCMIWHSERVESPGHHRSLHADFWRLFCLALALHLFSTAICIAATGGVVDAIGLTFWAAMAPRAASIVLAALAGGGVIQIAATVIVDRKWWLVVVLPIEIMAFVVANRAIPSAKSVIAEDKAISRAYRVRRAGWLGSTPASSDIHTENDDSEWYWDRGTWYCRAHETRYCKICSSRQRAAPPRPTPGA